MSHRGKVGSGILPAVICLTHTSLFLDLTIALPLEVNYSSSKSPPLWMIGYI